MTLRFIKKSSFLLPLLLVATISSCKESSTKLSSQDQFIHQKIDRLLEEMTFEEKLGQLSQRTIKSEISEIEQDIKDGKVGSVLVNLKVITDPAIRNRIQKLAVEESRLGIPIIFGQDVIHGFQTIFPTSLGQSCTWDTAMVKKAASIAANEATCLGIDWTFAPMIDVSRDARWGRIAECYGEDTYLNACFGSAAVKGFQGDDVGKSNHLVSCLKHYVGYAAGLGGRDYQYTDISERTMNEVYLPPFEACVNAGALTVMSAFNDINGVPASANPRYLKSILKDKWGFPGFVVSDWDAVVQLLDHGFAKDSIQAAIKAINAGVDMEMKSLTYKLLHENDINPKVLDDAVRRVLYVKFRKNLFENPYVSETRIETEVLTKENREFARKVAAESMVLLENKNKVLPISSSVKNIAIVGPFANEKMLMGWWKSNGKPADVVSPTQGFKNNAPENVKISEKITSATDLIVVCVGEKYDTFGENHSLSSIALPDNQASFIHSLKKYNKPIVTAVFNGRPLDLSDIKDDTDALLIAWHPGSEAGNAMADILFGRINPCGKLTTSFPASTGHIPVFYNERNSGRPWYDYYSRESKKPLYAFGYGLSYSDFKYSNLSFSKPHIKKDESLIIKAHITNQSDIPGHEVVQLYIRDMVGSTTRPVKELKGFKKIYLLAGETKEVEFTLNPSELAVLDESMTPQIEPGEFHVWIAPDSQKGIEGTFEIQ